MTTSPASPPTLNSYIEPSAELQGNESWAFTSSQIDLATLRRIVHRNGWIILAICGVGLALGLTITLLITPTYRA
ncbi:MAG: Wzz/FepE/Etk N-terminal domain-containing protein, partial [Sphingobium sp.]